MRDWGDSLGDYLLKLLHHYDLWRWREWRSRSEGVALLLEVDYGLKIRKICQWFRDWSHDNCGRLVWEHVCGLLIVSLHRFHEEISWYRCEVRKYSCIQHLLFWFWEQHLSVNYEIRSIESIQEKVCQASEIALRVSVAEICEFDFRRRFLEVWFQFTSFLRLIKRTARLFKQ